MAVSFVALNCDLTYVAGSTKVTTGTTTRTIGPSERIVVAATYAGTGITGLGPVVSVTVGALSLSLDFAVPATGNPGSVEYWSVDSGAGLASGQTVTVTWTFTGSAQRKGGHCFSLSGVDSSTPVRATPQNTITGSSSPASIASDSNPVAGDMAVSAIVSSSNRTFTPSGSFTSISSASNASLSDQCDYLALATGGAVTSTWTISGTFPSTNRYIVVYAQSSGPPPSSANSGFFLLMGA